MLKYIFLGFIQGLTEFFPISSSGHLILLKHWFNIEGDNLILNIVLHLATLLSIVVFFRKDIKNFIKNFPLWKNVIITTITTAVIAILFKNVFENFFTITRVSALGLGITSIILFSTFRRMNGKKKINELNVMDAILVGIFQAIAIIPGISRSGATISIQFWRRIDRQDAFRYSFLISIPAIIGASIMELPRLEYILNINPFGLIAGFLSAFFTGLIFLRILRLIIQKMRFPFFGYYCLAMALLAFFTLIESP